MFLKFLTVAIAASLSAAPILAQENFVELGEGFVKDDNRLAIAKTIDCTGNKLIFGGAGGELRPLWVDTDTWGAGEMRVLTDSMAASTFICKDDILLVITKSPTDIIYMKVGHGVEVSFVE